MLCVVCSQKPHVSYVSLFSFSLSLSLFILTLILHPSLFRFLSFSLYLCADEAVEQIQGDQYPLIGVRGRDHGEGGVSKRPPGGAR